MPRWNKGMPNKIAPSLYLLLTFSVISLLCKQVDPHAQ